METPDRKRLKSTYKPAAAPAPLAAGWTEHTAPSGHKYYYNAATKTSTYTRPVAAPTPPQSQPAFAPPAFPSTFPAVPYNQYPPTSQYDSYAQYNQSHPYVAPSQDPPRRRPQPQDRPKRKEVIPNCKPWVIVYTTLGRRFVHNTESNESFWKFPEDVMKAVVDFDRLKLDEKLGKAPEASGANKTPVGEAAGREPEKAEVEKVTQKEQSQEATEEEKPQEDAAAEDESKYEEIEVTDDEDEEDQPRQDADDQGDQEDQPVEFNEDDIAWQLAAMEDSYGLDPGEYGGEGDHEEGVEGLPLTDADGAALFCDLLEDLHINPYTPWDTLIEDGHIIDDSRYTALPTTKRRKEVWSDWSRDKIHFLKEQRAKTEKQDPRIPYLALLSEKATPKLYWPEFRRKFKKEDAMRDTKLADKDREKLYREHISRLKLSSQQLKSDLATLLKSMPSKSLNRDTTLDSLPKELLTDIRFISLSPKTRDGLVEAHISTLAPPPNDEEAKTEEQKAEQDRLAKERRRREQALRDREQQVEQEKRRRERDLRVGMGRLREGERELEMAMKVGREGLRAQLDGGGGQ